MFAKHRRVRSIARTWSFALVACIAACGASEEAADGAPLEPVLRCEAFEVPIEPRQIADDVAPSSVRMGPCGHVLFTDAEGVAHLAAPGGGEPANLGETLRGAAFAPPGDRLAYRDGDRLVVRHLATDRETTLGNDPTGAAVPGWVPSPTRPDDFAAYACVDGELRVLDEALRVLATDAFQCVVAATGAPVVLYRGTDGVLRRVHVGSGAANALPAVDYRSEGLSDRDLARGDSLLASPDGTVLVHQAMWRRPFGGFTPEQWATVYDGETGAEIGVFGTGDGYEPIEPLAIPGSGHVLVFPVDGAMVVVDGSRQLLGYEGWEVLPSLAGDLVLAHEAASREVHRIDAARGQSRGVVLADVSDTAQLAVSAGGEAVAARRVQECNWLVSGGDCRIATTAVRWRAGSVDEVEVGEGRAELEWAGTRGELLIRRALASDDGSVETSLFDADGRLLARWGGITVAEVRQRDDTLLAVTSAVGTGGAELRAVDLRSGEVTVLASSERNVQLWTQGSGRVLAWVRGILEEGEGGAIRLRQSLHLGPVP